MTLLLDDVKQALRIKAFALDNEIEGLIDSSKADLKLSGLLESKIMSDDILIKRAIILYCKGHFGLDNNESEKYISAYENIKIHLCLSQEYTVEVI